MLAARLCLIIAGTCSLSLAPATAQQARQLITAASYPAAAKILAFVRVGDHVLVQLVLRQPGTCLATAAAAVVLHTLRLAAHELACAHCRGLPSLSRLDSDSSGK